MDATESAGMLAVTLERGTVRVERSPLPQRRPGHALLRMRLAGICSTDLHLQRGYYGFSGRPGHEFVAEVVECDQSQWLGKRVVGEINLACRQCDWCARRLGRHCPNRTVLGIVKHPGAFAEYLTLPEENLHEAPAQLSDEELVFTEPVAAACEILEQVRIPDAAPVAVLGDGKLGLLIAQVLQLSGARVHVYGRHAHKMQLLSPLGIAYQVIGEVPPQVAYDFVVDATGSSAGLQHAVAITRPRGTLILKSTVHDRVVLDTAPVIVNELTLVGSRCGRFEPALELLASRRLILRPLIHDVFPLAQAQRAFERAAEKGVLKVLLKN
ncbi:MAG: alcohol dehydrogenase catalytic domain-containing protein [Bryobacteraceae bacterium]|nr:alcohol dehydrogenase catalytic domain-containing protein [Bryobacteraceae bacterium]MDW8377790.1 alcohol dehydrogenase catalytic domain-containing protein [Bryobacterales bacterium]